MKTPPADDEARYAELLASATEDENAGRWDAASLKLKLAQAHRNTPEVSERLARAARRGAPAPAPTRTTPGARTVSGVRAATDSAGAGERVNASAPPLSSRSTPGARVPPVSPAPSPSRPRATPMPMLLLSVLRNQHLMLGAGFVTRYPHPWLVWELGPRRPATSATERNTLETQQPASAGAPKVPSHDPLCFPLFGTSLRLGRGDDCAIVIDDVTFSRDAGVLSLVGASWAFHPAAGGAPVPLDAGRTLESGDVMLTFETSTSFVVRLTRPSSSP